jgi:hypothetical protein
MIPAEQLIAQFAHRPPVVAMTVHLGFNLFRLRFMLPPVKQDSAWCIAARHAYDCSFAGWQQKNIRKMLDFGESVGEA